MSDGLRHFLSLLAVIGAIAVPLLIAGLGADEVQAPQDRLSAAEVAGLAPGIADGVESVRELRFKREPRVEIVTPAGLRRLYEEELERTEEREDLDAQAEVLKLLGLIEPGEDLLDIAADSVELVAGAYDPRTRQLVVVDAAGLTAPAIVEFILAHELTHALEDQRFDLRRLDRLRDDRQLAAQALVEGSATHLMTEYAVRYQDLSELLDAALDPELAQSASGDGLPDIVRAQLLFPYLRGETFVSELVDLGQDWDLVDIAYRERLPLSTEQILHPEKYLSYERPSHPPLDLGPALGDGWRRLTEGTLGEFDTIQLLRSGGDDESAREAAAGWGGARYELWRRGSTAECDDDPCRSREVLALAWRWDTPADARQFATAVPDFLQSGLEARRRSDDLWSLGNSVIELRQGPRSTSLLFSPARVADGLTAGSP